MPVNCRQYSLVPLRLALRVLVCVCRAVPVPLLPRRRSSLSVGHSTPHGHLVGFTDLTISQSEPSTRAACHMCTETPPRGVHGDVMCGEVGSDRIFETSKSGEFSGFELSVILFLWENKKNRARPISIFFETLA